VPNITQDSNGKFFLDVMTPEELNEWLNSGRAKGQYVPVIDTFAKSGEMVTCVSELSQFKGKSLTSVRQSFNNNIRDHSNEKKWPRMRVEVREHEDQKYVVLTNVEVLEARLAELAAST
jgi:hypothetical protein